MKRKKREPFRKRLKRGLAAAMGAVAVIFGTDHRPSFYRTTSRQSKGV